MKIGILTTFSNLKPEYSLATVVVQQLKALVKYNYEPVLFVLNNFSDDDKIPEDVQLRKVIPQLLLEPYAQRNLSNLESDKARARQAMSEHMQDIDVCLTHDIIFINTYLPYNCALREAIDDNLGHIKWLHWIHSGPSARPQMDGSPYDNLFTLPKNSLLVYMNYTDAIRAAEMYGIWPKDVRTIFNPMDIRDLYDFHPVSRALCDNYDLLSSDVIITYPLSTTRMNDDGKQLSKVIWIAGHLKQQGKSVRLLVPNGHANAKEQKDDIEDMYKFAHTCGLERRELIFTSLFEAPKWEQGVPHEAVKDLFTLSNVFIFPSVSENCPLILLEAMAAKNLLILNKSFQAMHDFALHNAHYFKFGSLEENVNYEPSLDHYLSDVAKIITSELNTNKALGAATLLRQKFNIDYIFKQQLEPAILEIYHGTKNM